MYWRRCCLAVGNDLLHWNHACEITSFVGFPATALEKILTTDKVCWLLVTTVIENIDNMTNILPV